MFHKRQKIMSYILVIMAVTVMILGSSFYSSVSAVSSQSSMTHHKAFVKKQDGGSKSHDGGSSRSKDTGIGNDGDSSSDNSGGSSTSSSDKTVGHTDDSSSDGSSITSDTKSSDSSNRLGNSDNDNNNKNNDQATNDVGNTGESQRSGDQPTCEQGSNCTDQQGLSDRDRSTTTTTATKQEDNAPFVLSLHFLKNTHIRISLPNFIDSSRVI